MGQTLTHGIYLPDEGERNCYDGLAANWQLLDSSVGTIAEHTTALAGKAPAVHTHVKADITDLFNSANTWNALNSYSNGQIRIKSQNQEIGVIPSSGVIQYLEFADKNDAQHGIVGLWDYADGASEIQMYIADKFKNGAKDPTGTSESTFLSFGFKTDGSKFLAFSGQVDNSVIPKTNNTYDLGSSSYQWNNVYAKNYYYNGTAWGLDKANHWTNNNTFYTTVRVKSLTQEIGVTPSESKYIYCDFRDKNEVNIAQIITAQFANGYDTISLNMYNKYTNGVKNPNGSSINAKFETGLTPAGQAYLNTNGKWLSDLTPIVSNLNLGTSTNKWKSLNGINPGALSLPNSPGGTGTVNVNYYDLSGNITVRDGHTYNSYIAPCDGWIAISSFASWLQISNDTLLIATTANPGADGFAQAFLPVRKGNAIRIVINQTNTQFQSFKLLPCEGNV